MLLDELMDELLQMVCSHLSVVDIFALDRTCRRLAAATLWKHAKNAKNLDIASYIFTAPSQTLVQMVVQQCVNMANVFGQDFLDLCKSCCIYPIFVRHILQHPQFSNLIVDHHCIQRMATHLAKCGSLAEFQGYFTLIYRYGYGKTIIFGSHVLMAIGLESPVNDQKLEWIFKKWHVAGIPKLSGWNWKDWRWDDNRYSEPLLVALVRLYPDKMQPHHVSLFHRACRRAELNLLKVLQVTKRTVQTIQTAKNLCQMVPGGSTFVF